MHESTVRDILDCSLMWMLVWAPALFIYINIKDIEDTFK